MANPSLDVCGYAFDFVCDLVPERDTTGRIIEFVYELPAGVRGNRYADGPFCTLRVPGPPSPGIYCLTLNGRVVYVGQARDFAKRWGPVGYGHIHARNCHSDGQSTNCKINATVLAYAKAGTPLSLWFHATRDLNEVENHLLNALRPELNGQRPTGRRAPTPTKKQRERSPNMMPTTDDFRRALHQEFQAAQEKGMKSIRIISGDFHRQVGGYPGTNHRMPLCCNAMHGEVNAGDVIVSSPPSGKGATLTIEYMLPR
ncbi:MAG: hypothetical protein K1X67_16505 [Fimbriimonadaceae bacterium]|nr:hypothetical protein [Fimbriimonadaceae bacterium]